MEAHFNYNVIKSANVLFLRLVYIQNTGTLLHINITITFIIVNNQYYKHTKNYLNFSEIILITSNIKKLDLGKFRSF